MTKPGTPPSQTSQRRGERGMGRISFPVWLGDLLPKADDQVDPGNLGTLRRDGQAAELHRWDGDVDEGARGDIVEVIVRVDVRIEPRP